MNNSSKFKFSNLQVGDNDLIGNKFTGHDLHLYLRQNYIDSHHLVWKKDSNDKYTHRIAEDKKNRDKIKNNILDIQRTYSLNGILNPFTYDILYSKLFLESDIIHFHLIHNNILDILLLPIMSKLKPTVWSLHDPWALNGHCIYSFDCMKWESGCGDCPYLDTPFPMIKDNTRLNYLLKKQAILNSQLNIIVASKWMLNKVKKSPVFRNAKIHLIPYGINTNIFKSLNKNRIRMKLGIPKDAFVISFRCTPNPFKGIEYIKYFLRRNQISKDIFLLLTESTFSKKDKDILKKYKMINFGWVKDDQLMAEIYNASDLFLMPSNMEAFGLMSVEAMCCGVLPITIKGTALSDVVNAPYCGVSVIRNKDAYAQTVEYYIKNDTERQNRARKSMQYARRQFDKEVYLKKIISVYKHTMDSHYMDIETKTLLTQLKKYMLNDLAIKDTFSSIQEYLVGTVKIDNTKKSFKSKFKNSVIKFIRSL